MYIYRYWFIKRFLLNLACTNVQYISDEFEIGSGIFGVGELKFLCGDFSLG